ncbi:hypothetical protein Leryth_016995, partial [Lithospermum erythrorhizon]
VQKQASIETIEAQMVIDAVLPRVKGISENFMTVRSIIWTGKGGAFTGEISAEQIEGYWMQSGSDTLALRSTYGLLNDWLSKMFQQEVASRPRVICGVPSLLQSLILWHPRRLLHNSFSIEDLYHHNNRAKRSSYSNYKEQLQQAKINFQFLPVLGADGLIFSLRSSFASGKFNIQDARIRSYTSQLYYAQEFPSSVAMLAMVLIVLFSWTLCECLNSIIHVYNHNVSVTEDNKSPVMARY